MIAHPSELLNYISRSRIAELGSDRVEVRLMSITIAIMFFYQLSEPGTYILFVGDSTIHRVSSLTGLRSGLGVLFYLTAAMVVPHIFMLIFFPSKLNCKLPRQLVCLASISGAVLWGLLATVAMPLDQDWLSTVFGLRAFVDLGLGILFGLSLNAQHAKEAIEQHAYVEKEMG